MALNLDAVGKPFAPLTKDYTWKDVVLYALGVGAGFSDLDYCYEKNLKVIPSFSIASIFDILMQTHGKLDLYFTTHTLATKFKQRRKNFRQWIVCIFKQLGKG